MKHLLKLLPLFVLAASLFPNNSFANIDDEYTYTIHLGAFVKAKLSDFNSIRSLGYIYSEKGDNNLIRIYMGDYETEPLAYKTLNKVKESGYPDAFVTRKKLSRGTEVRVIQLGVETAGANIDWKRYNQAGKLHTALVGQQVKILSGPYSDLEETQNKLIAIRALGFKDAFTKKINDILLHPVTEFEAGMQLADTEVSTFEEAEEILTEKAAPKVSLIYLLSTLFPSLYGLALLLRFTASCMNLVLASPSTLATSS